jgi:predicted DNA-binding antitoxin AbrB/MazE fold protein
MREQIEVIYENGILRPLGTLSDQFQEHQHLTVTVEDADNSTDWLAGADPTVSLEAVRRALGKVPVTIAQLIHAEREER